VLVIALAVFTLGITFAFAAAPEHSQKAPSELLFIAQIMALILVGRLLGELMLRIKQPAVIGPLIAGLILGPSLFGLLLPNLQHALFPNNPQQKAMIDAVSQFGILMLLLLTGMETDLKLVRQTGRAAVLTSLMGIIVPFACGVTLGQFLPESFFSSPHQRLVTSLFLGTALSIASVKIVAMVIREMNFTRRIVGQVILASAIIDDCIGWIIVSIIFSLAAHDTINAGSLLQSVFGILLFLGVSLTAGRRVVFFVIRWVNDSFASEYAVITAILLIMGFMALITYLIGVHMVLGAFIAGVLIGESPMLTRHIGEQLRGLIMALFAPVFFGVSGLSADLTILASVNTVLLTVGLILIASLGKFGGALAGGQLGGLTWREGFALACGMNARGSTEVIIANIGLSMGALTHDLYTMIVTMAVVTTMAMPPTLRFALARLPMRKEEKQRLEREEREARGFVPNLERILIAVDDSANGRFAARVGGILAGTNGIPATILRILDATRITTEKHGSSEAEAPWPQSKSTEKSIFKKTRSLQEKKALNTSETVKRAAEQIKNKQPKEEKIDLPVAVTTTVHEAPSADLITTEAKKGYDIFIIGLEKASRRDNEFSGGVTSLALGFDGALAIGDVRGSLAKHLESRLNILVPVNGTEPSRRAAEIAIAMARATNALITVLYVAVRPPSRRKLRRQIRRRWHEEAILKDIVSIADDYNIGIRTAVLSDVAADEAILEQAKQRKNNLIILGVGRRPGVKLFFGDTAASLLKNSECSLLFVAT
jgi:Kef-type K+ transport system membrane component KefB/nucleotide-binding universal stress UspA family protein